MHVIRVKTVSSLKDVLRHSTELVVVKLGARWCKPCAKVAPYFHKLAASGAYKVRWVEVELGEDDVEAELYTYCRANKIPYFTVFKRGELVKGIQTSDISMVETLIKSAA